MLKHIKELLSVLMGTKAQTMTMMAASVGSALLYGITSTSMAFINKVILDVYHFNYPMIIMTLQMIVSFTIVKVIDFLGYIKLKPLTRSSLLQFSGPCFFYSLNGVLSLAALGQMNLTMYSVVKRNGPLVTMVLSCVFLKKGFPGRFVIFGVLLMSFGCIVAANGDITFDVEAYGFGVGSVLSQALYLILLQRLSESYSTTDTLYMNSVLSFPFLAVTTGVFGEYSRAYHYDRYKEIGYIISMTVLLFMGSFLNFTLFLCNNNNSALTTSVVGTLKSVAQTTLGMFTFGGVSINTYMITGVTMNMTGGVVYTWAKYKESQNKIDMKKIASENNLDQIERGPGREAASNINNNKTSDTIIHLHPIKDGITTDEKKL